MQTRIRMQKTMIDSPTQGSTPWVEVILQKVIKDDDGKVIQVIDRVDRINKSLESFMSEEASFTDPVTGEPITISGAGVAEAVRVMILSWIQEQFDGHISDENQFIED